jgi:simple sugar transport system ATP-binding protein
MMVGRGVELQVKKSVAKPGEAVLEAQDLTVIDESGRVAVDGVSFAVRTGEIVAIAGVQGNGQTEVAEAITGLATVVDGSIRIAGLDLTGASPRRFLHAGVANIPEDRQKDGLVGDFTIAENLVLDTYDEPPFSHAGALDWKEINRTAVQRLSDFDIRAPSIHVAVRTLSGGNQQKVIVARELPRTIKCIVAAQPTRGLDIGSIEYVHSRLVAARDAGVGILLISAELDEVMSLADRIIVMYRGRMVGPFDTGVLSREQIGLLMAGSALETAVPGGHS